MAYITIDYYKTTYLGNDPGDDTELARLIARAADLVDVMTDNKAQDYDNLPAYQQTAIQKATAYQVEYLVENGDIWADNLTTSEKIGQWSVSQSSPNAITGNPGPSIFSKVAKSYLVQNDLMSAIIGVTDNETDCL